MLYPSTFLDSEQNEECVAIFHFCLLLSACMIYTVRVVLKIKVMRAFYWEIVGTLQESFFFFLYSPLTVFRVIEENGERYIQLYPKSRFESGTQLYFTRHCSIRLYEYKLTILPFYRTFIVLDLYFNEI